MNYNQLVQESIEARTLAYVKYSKFPVGAALLTKKGLFLGANIENSSYSLCMCAERTAIFRAHLEGCQKEDYISIAVNGDTDEPIRPCGACLQVMAEFFSPDTEVVLSNRDGAFKVYKFSDLLPFGFTDLK